MFAVICKIPFGADGIFMFGEKNTFYMRTPSWRN